MMSKRLVGLKPWRVLNGSFGSSSFVQSSVVATSIRSASTTSSSASGTSKKLDIRTSPLSHHSLLKYSSIGLLGLVPAGLALPANLAHPVDLVLGIVIPLHMQLGMSDVVRDYVPNQAFFQWILLAVSIATAFGLTKLNFSGDGISATVKRLWTTTAQKKD